VVRFFWLAISPYGVGTVFGSSASADISPFCLPGTGTGQLGERLTDGSYVYFVAGAVLSGEEENEAGLKAVADDRQRGGLPPLPRLRRGACRPRRPPHPHTALHAALER
jgi:hypothetical protein